MFLYVVIPALAMCAVFEWIFPKQKEEPSEEEKGE